MHSIFYIHTYVLSLSAAGFFSVIYCWLSGISRKRLFSLHTRLFVRFIGMLYVPPVFKYVYLFVNTLFFLRL